MARRRVNVFSLSFLDAMTCGFGAVVLFYMIVNASFGKVSGRMTADLQGEVDRLEEEVLDGYVDLVEIRNSLEEIDQEFKLKKKEVFFVLDDIKRETYLADDMVVHEHLIGS